MPAFRLRYSSLLLPHYLNQYGTSDRLIYIGKVSFPIPPPYITSAAPIAQTQIAKRLPHPLTPRWCDHPEMGQWFPQFAAII